MSESHLWINSFIVILVAKRKRELWILRPKKTQQLEVNLTFLELTWHHSVFISPLKPIFSSRFPSKRSITFLILPLSTHLPSPSLSFSSPKRSSSSVPLSWHFWMSLLWMSRLKDCYLPHRYLSEHGPFKGSQEIKKWRGGEERGGGGGGKDQPPDDVIYQGFNKSSIYYQTVIPQWFKEETRFSLRQRGM